MEKLYIKFIEWNQDSLNKACKEAERLGYKKLDKPNALKFEGYWTLSLREYWSYFTSCTSIETLLTDWFKEHKIQEEEIFESWEQVAVSQTSKEDAIKELETDRVKYFYVWKNRDWKYIIEIGTWNNHYSDFKYIAKIPQIKKRKIKCTDDQFEEIKKILNNK